MDFKFDLKPLVNRFNALDERARYTIFGLFLVVVVGLDYFLVLRLQAGFLRKVGEGITTLSQDTARVRADAQRINDIKKGLEDMRSQLQALNNKVRPLQEIPAVLSDIARIANDSGVSIDQLVPAKEGPESLLTSGDTKYYALPIVVSAHSGYHMFGRFLNKLESGNLLFLVRGLRMETGDIPANNLAVQATLKVVLADRAEVKK